MNAKDVISYIHADMDKKYRLQDTTECHAAILKDWMRNDAFLPDQWSYVKKTDTDFRESADTANSTKDFLRFLP